MSEKLILRAALIIIGSEILSLERTLQTSEPALSRKLWQRCETPQSPSYDSPDIQKSLMHFNFSQQILNLQLTS